MPDEVRFVGERDRCPECMEHIGHLSTCSKFEWRKPSDTAKAQRKRAE